MDRRPPAPTTATSVTTDEVGDGTALRRIAAAIADLAEPARSADALRYALRFLAAGISVCVAHDDTEAPALGTMTRDRMSWGLDNPDCLYRYTRVDPTATYRLSGRLGTCVHTELQVNTGHFGDGDFAGWRAVSALGADDLATTGDGEIEVWLAPERPVGGDGRPVANWLALDADASFLLVRQYFGDWEHEAPAELVIDRIETAADSPRRGHAALPPRPYDAADAARQVDLLVQWLGTGARCWQQLSDAIRGGEPGPITPFLPPASASGLKGQAYGFGAWRCRPGEAVVVEVAPPPCRLWSVALADPSWQSIDFADRQSSLNGAQAPLIDDGRFVGVIAHDDPGVATWLDPGGHVEGTLALRYLFDPAAVPDPEAGPLPALRSRVVPVEDLDAELPVGLPRVTPAERADALARRRAAVARRGGL